MNGGFDKDSKRAIRLALARDAYQADVVRLADTDLGDSRWLVSTNRGVVAVSPYSVKTVIHGWFFGIHRHDDHVYLFESCGQYDFSRQWGRIIRLRIENNRLVDPIVLVRGLHHNCHQLKVIDGLICLLDTANQQVLRFTLAGVPVDELQPFPVAPLTDTSGAYLHFNSIAEVGGRIAVMLHNGKAMPEKNSELAWLDRSWRVIERIPLAGRLCHDVVSDESGAIWHCASDTGEIISSTGVRHSIAPGAFTRGLAWSGDHLIVGVAAIAPRNLRDQLACRVSFHDRNLDCIGQIGLSGAPTDVAVLWN